jgi:2,5-diamino-6-(ribosylamino)-4(3H)-pyrimidinone 5'-phosphate reductase
MVNSKPKVTLSAAITLDGKIGQKNKHIVLSSKYDKIRVHKLRAKSDAIVVGKNTVRQDDPLLTVRYAKGKNPIRIILDSHGTIKNDSRIIKTCKRVPTIIVLSELVSKSNLNRLQKLPVEVIVCGKNHVNLIKLLSILSNKGIKTILLEGGGTLNRSFLNKNLIDEMIIALTPYVLGSKNTIDLFEGVSFPELKTKLPLKLKNIQKNGNEIILNYKF